jgi:sugar phosphate isomerase/epimerase
MKTAPRLWHVLNLWSLSGYPSPQREWTLERKIRAVKEAGFDGFAELSTAEHQKSATKHGLMIVGYFASAKASEFRRLLQQNKDAGAHHINVQLGDHDTSLKEALRLAIKVMEEGRKLGVEPAIETHRDTCTETPEKIYALADAYEKETGELLPMTWDFSHLAVVKHLAPASYIERMIIRPDLIGRAQQFHLRPFNGHHCQVPVTNGRGALSKELNDWLPFAKALLATWLKVTKHTDIYVVPEMGPAGSGYNLHQLPNSWEDACVLRKEIQRIWQECFTDYCRTEAGRSR